MGWIGMGKINGPMETQGRTVALAANEKKIHTQQLHEQINENI